MTVIDKNYKHPIAELPNFLKTKKTFSWKYTVRWDRPFFYKLTVLMMSQILLISSLIPKIQLITTG